MAGEKNFDFDFNFNYESGKEETLERIEKQCDRETKEIIWGFYKSETINCPAPQSKNEESEEDEDYQDNSEQDDVD
ncbi:hypothetical protein F7734_34905 [Scytonema sp. UIC 10036]|uniref:hypothetical protein n=1 Tax=Scytonema sp. UIC 10036 TaxID=2304196 RepID=UPI0012DA1BD5|nr:hypothetical protein [Scytonema sp. UIC 10036]MUG97246.1 hypothetical protein [Scytonema sp. UIC 10036]